jgi:hypothetical protein
VIASDSGSIMLLEDKDLVVYAVKGFANPDSMLNVHLNLDTAPLNHEVVESKRPLIIGSVHEDERWLEPMEISGMDPELRDIHLRRAGCRDRIYIRQPGGHRHRERPPL